MKLPSLVAGVCVLAMTMSVSAQQPTSAPAGRLWGRAASAPTTQSAGAASRPAIDLPDLAKNAIDPYDPAAEREKFFKAAGVDNELTAEEFAADGAKEGGFVRKFDSWRAILAFDKNKNGTIDWFEADAYRTDLRKKVLAEFDLNKDGKLTAGERDAANRFLLALGALRDRPAQPAGGDAQVAAAGGDSGEAADRARLRRWARDNGDAAPTDPDKGTATGKAGRKMSAQQEKMVLKHFDANNDGVLDENEQAQADAFAKEMQKVGKEFETALLDRDGDGVVTDEERKEAQAEFTKAAGKIMLKMGKYMDADGDGQVSDEERANFGKRAQAAMTDWAEKFAEKYDTDGDGRLLTEQERAAVIQGFHEEIAKRKAKYDTNNDGKLDADELVNMMDDFMKEIGLVGGKKK